MRIVRVNKKGNLIMTIEIKFVYLKKLLLLTLYKLHLNAPKRSWRLTTSNF